MRWLNIQKSGKTSIMNSKLKLVLVFLGGVITTLVAMYFLRNYIAYILFLIALGVVSTLI